MQTFRIVITDQGQIGFFAEDGTYQQGKQNIYVNFATNITKNCDCISNVEKPILKQIGIIASNDILACEQATVRRLAITTGKLPPSCATSLTRKTYKVA